MIEQFVLLLRMVAVGAAVMLLAIFVAHDIAAKIRLPLLGMVVGVIGYLVNATPLMMASNPADPFIDLIAISTPFWIWLFARRLFEREPERRLLYAAVGVLIFGWFIQNFLPSTSPAGFLLLHFSLLGLIADVVRIGIFEREDDLVEQRRLIRLWLPLLIGAQAAAILIFELAELAFGLGSPIGAQLFQSFMILLIMLFAGMVLLRTDAELLSPAQTELDEEEAPVAPLDLSPSETVLYEKLTAAMDDGAYRETGLTIAGLAEQLDTPEHRLRALINQRLGHRNFSAFLNRHRIAEAKQNLSSRASVDLPVLTIAMDLGYNSLPTFNRAFRAETGTTPSEYRRNAIGDAPAKRETGE